MNRKRDGVEKWRRGANKSTSAARAVPDHKRPKNWSSRCARMMVRIDGRGQRVHGYHELPELPCTRFELHEDQANAERLRHDLQVASAPLQVRTLRSRSDAYHSRVQQLPQPHHRVIPTKAANECGSYCGTAGLRCNLPPSLFKPRRGRLRAHTKQRPLVGASRNNTTARYRCKVRRRHGSHF